MSDKENNPLEFRYEKVDIKKQIYITVLISVVWLLIILWSWKDSPGGILFYIFTGVAAYRYFKFYTKEQSTVIKLDEISVMCKSKDIETKILWDQVTNVKFEGYGNENLNLLVIEDAHQKIQIGTNIKDIHLIIDFVRSKLQNKFDMTSIPIEFKVPQRKWNQ